MCESALTSREPQARPAGASRVLVLGIGNSLLTDDGAGVQAIAQLRADASGASMELVDGGTLNFTLLQYLEDNPAVIVIDAADLDAAPGTVRVFEGEEMDRVVAGGRRNSVHEAGLADMLGIARLRDCLPGRRALITVQPAHVGWGEALSPAVQQALPGICERARQLVARWSLADAIPEPAA